MFNMTTNNYSVRRYFEVVEDVNKNGGLQVRLTFTFTVSGMYAPLYVSISGFTVEEVSADACPDEILV